MWYILYERDALWAQGQEKRGEGFFHSSGSLDGSETRRTHVVMDFSRSFVHNNSSLRFVNIFFCTVFCIHFTHIVARHVSWRASNDFWHLCLPQFYGVAKKSYIPADCLSPIVEFCEQSNLNSSTRTQVHGYILQVVNFYRFYNHPSFFN